MELIILITKRMGGLVGVAGFMLLFLVVGWWLLRQSNKMITEEFGEETAKNTSSF